MRRVLGAEPSRRRGLTLVELLLSLTIVSLLLLASGSMMVVLAKTAPGANTTASRIDQSSHVMEQLASELEEATAILTWSAAEIEFEVSDRDGDLGPETIRYLWSGSEGTPAPLTRQYNAGRSQVMIESAYEFALDYDVAVADPTMDEPETMVSGYTSSALVTTQTLTKSIWPGQYFTPALPGDAVSWTLTRVRFKATPAGPSSGDFFVQLRTVDGSSLPTTTIIDQVTVLESELPASMDWHEVIFSGANGLTPTDGYALVLEYNSGSNAMDFEFEDGGAGLVGAGMVEYDKGTWVLDPDESLSYEVHGIATVPDPDGVAEDRLRGVTVTMNPGEDTESQLQMRARMLNTPALP